MKKLTKNEENIKKQSLIFRKEKLSIHNKAKYFKTKTDIFRIIAIILITVLSIIVFVLFCFYDGKKLINFELEAEFIKRNNDLIIRKIITNPISIVIASLGLSFSGFGMQIVSRNPLASPTTLGYLPSVILGLSISKIATSDVSSIPFILGIGFGVSIIIFNFLMIRGNLTQVGFKPILVGFAIGGMFSGINVLIEEFAVDFKAEIVGFQVLPINQVYTQIYVAGPLVLISIIINLLLTAYYEIISKDVILAKSLGIKVDLIFWITAICAVVATVSSIILVGVLTLLGMVAPHIAKIINPKGKIISNFFLSFVIAWLLLTSSQWVVDAYPSFDINLFSSIAALPVFIFIFVSKRYKKNVE